MPTSDVNKANQLQQTLQHCFAASDIGGINIVNPDIYLVGAYSGSKITGQRYSIQLKILIFDQRVMTIKHQVKDTKTLVKPGPNGDVPHLYCSTIKKIIDFNGESKVIWQQIMVPFEGSGVISKIISRDSEFEEKEILEDRPIEEYSIQELLDLASEYYSKKKYEKAFYYYSLVVEKEPYNSEALERMSYMIYDNKGCKVSERKKRAREAMEKAMERADEKKRREMEDYIYYIDHPNFY